MRLLLVEDNVPLADELIGQLGRHGYATDWLADGRDADYQGSSEPYDLIVLDLGLPGKPGLEVLRAWRARGLAAPVLILTARDSWAERIEGLKAGADDYLTKPFHPEELLLRIQALLRRSHGGQATAAQVLQSGKMILDTGRRELLVDGVPVELTPSEFGLLQVLMENPGYAFTRTELRQPNSDAGFGIPPIILARREFPPHRQTE